MLTVLVDKKWVQTKEKTVDSYDSSIKPNVLNVIIIFIITVIIIILIFYLIISIIIRLTKVHIYM